MSAFRTIKAQNNANKARLRIKRIADLDENGK